MLRNMKVGTKLLAVVLPPLLVLVAVAGIGARDRLAEAGDARTAEAYIEITRVGGNLIAELQRERTLSVVQAGDADAAADELTSQRDATDAARAAFLDLADDLDTASAVSEPVEAGRGRLTADLETIRASVDRGSIDPLIVHQWYVDTVGDQIDVATAVSNEVPFAEVSADLTSYVALARATEAQAKRASVFAIALAQGEFDADGRLWREDRALVAEYQRYESLFFDLATARQAADLRGAQRSAAYDAVEDFREPVMNRVAVTVNLFGDGTAVGEPLVLDAELLDEVVDAPADVTVDAAFWLSLTDAQLSTARQPGNEVLGTVAGVVSDVRESAEQQALLFLLVTAAAVLVSGVVAMVVARRITKPLRHLTDAADRLSGEQLPALVERLKSPGSHSGEILLEPIGMKRTDEIGQLADAFDAIQRVTVDVAEEQASLLKKGIGDIFVNLARRNQTLLDRQIEFIDQLESSEEDPDVLEDLFKLDHLATRMRRNAESLLVLAGVETSHRRSRPVPLADVVRVAIGEVEDFARLNLLAMDDAVVSGTAAMDVAHLLSEIMENATSFSPPETKVEIIGHRNADGSYVLSVSDQGIGMSDEQFAEINQLLADPPLVGLTLSRSLGFTVVGRLAARFAIDVRLTSSPSGGVTALVTVPAAVLEESPITVHADEGTEIAPPQAIEAPDSAAASTPGDTRPESEAPAAFAPPSSAPEMPVAEPPAPDWVPDAPAPSTLASAVPEGAAFDEGLAALIGDDAPAEPHSPRPASAASTPEGPSLFGAPAEAEAAAAAETPAPSRTSAGLVKRVPRASAASSPEPTERPSDEAPVARTQRSPEEVRAMLSRYRSGLHRGRDGDSPNGSSADGSN